MPTTYVIPTGLPCTPTPPSNMSSKQPLLLETIEDSVDDKIWKEDLWKVMDGKTKQQIEQWLTYNSL